MSAKAYIHVYCIKTVLFLNMFKMNQFLQCALDVFRKIFEHICLLIDINHITQFNLFRQDGH